MIQYIFPMVRLFHHFRFMRVISFRIQSHIKVDYQKLYKNLKINKRVIMDIKIHARHTQSNFNYKNGGYTSTSEHSKG